jgi:hypothetical protein
LRARYYDHSTGRFTRGDDYEGRLGDPLTLHKYFYTHANPINGIDPSGYLNIGSALEAVVIVGILAALAYTPGTSTALGRRGEGISKDEALRIERNILAYTHSLTPIGGDPKKGGYLCDALTFAALMQFAAGQIRPTQWVNDRATRLDFLGIAVDMFTGTDLSTNHDIKYSSFGKLGNSGSRPNRPEWLKTHSDDTRLWKRFVSRDSEEERYNTYDQEAGSGRRDHFLINAMAGYLAGTLGDGARYFMGERSENDVAYNRLGREFGDDLVIRGNILQLGVHGWILSRMSP